jgi:WD40 repeat protein
MVLTAAHNVDYRRDLGNDEQLLIRTIAGIEFAVQVVLVCDEASGVDLALLEIIDHSFGGPLQSVTFARIDRDSPAKVPDCWAVGFPRFGEAGPVLPEGSRKETWHVSGEILPGTKLRVGLLSLQVNISPEPLPASLAGSAWEGMSGAVVFAADPHGNEQVAVGVISVHHRPEGPSVLTAVPVTAVGGLATAFQWWAQLRVDVPGALPLLPPPSVAAQRKSRLAGEQALREHWDPHGRGVERAARPGWYFTGRRQALSQLVAWLIAPPTPTDNVRVVTGGPGSGKSAVLARLITMSNLGYRANMPLPLATDDPVFILPPGVIDVAVHARTASVDEVVSALASAAGAPRADLDVLIDTLLQRREPFTVAVDALDEADDAAALARTLQYLASETADAGVRLLVGTRPGGPDRRLIIDLGLSAQHDDTALIDLDTPAYLSRRDLAEYVGRRLLAIGAPSVPRSRDTPYRDKEILAHQVADAVADAAYPAFLIGQLVSRALLLRAKPLGPHDPGWQQFPKTVAEAMDRYLASVGDQAEQDWVEDLLRPLAFARGDGLPLDDTILWPRLATALARPGRNYTTGDVAKLLDTAADYLVETVIVGEAAYYRLYHQALSDRLRERDQQHRRPVTSRQAIYYCLLDTVASRADGSRDWLAAHPYLHDHLAGHAADADQLTPLIDDPGFLVAANPAGLLAALQRPGQPPTANAQIYRYAYPQLTPGVNAAGERASYLQLAALRRGSRLADQFGRMPLQQPWVARWIRGQRPHSHFIVGRHQLIRPHDGWVNAVAVGQRHDRPVIISGGADETVRVWDLESGELVLGPLTGHSGAVDAVAVGERYGRSVIVSGSYDGTVRVWDLESGDLTLGPLHSEWGWVNSVAIGYRQENSPVIVSASASNGEVRVWDLESGELLLGPPTGHEVRGSSVAIGERDGRIVVVSGSYDGTVRVWDLESGELLLGPLTGHDGRIRAVAVGERYGKPVIISAGRDQTVRVWDLRSGELVLAPLVGHDEEIYAIAVGEQHHRPIIVSGGLDKTMRVWGLDSGELVLGPLTGHDGAVSAVAVGNFQDRPFIVSGSSDETVRAWDLEPDDPIPGNNTGHSNGVKAVTIGERYGRLVVISGGQDETVRVWDLESGDPVLGPLTGHEGWVNTVAIGERYGQSVIVSGADDKTLRVWDLESGNLVLGPLTEYGAWVGAVAVSEREGQPVIASACGDMQVWDLESGDLVLGPLTAPECPVFEVAIGERYGRLVIVSGGVGDYGRDNTIWGWDLESGDLVFSARTVDVSEVNALAAGRMLGLPIVVAGAFDGAVRVWDLQSGDLVLGPITGHQGAVQTVAIGERDRRPVIISGGNDRTLRIWYPESEQHPPLQIALEHEVLAVCAVPHGLVVGTTAELLYFVLR